MQFHQGYTPPKCNPSHTKLDCKLQISLYGLRQSSRQWNAKFSSFLIIKGFMKSKVKYFLFYKGHGSTYVSLLVYVYDIVLIGASTNEIHLVLVRLSVELKLKHLGNLKHILGVEIARDHKRA